MNARSGFEIFTSADNIRAQKLTLADIGLFSTRVDSELLEITSQTSATIKYEQKEIVVVVPVPANATAKGRTLLALNSSRKRSIDPQMRMRGQFSF